MQFLSQILLITLIVARNIASGNPVYCGGGVGCGGGGGGGGGHHRLRIESDDCSVLLRGSRDV